VLGQSPPESDLPPKIPDSPDFRHGFGRRAWRCRTGGDTIDDGGIGKRRTLPQVCCHDKRVLGGFHRARQRGVGSPPLDKRLVAMPFDQRIGPDEPELRGGHEGGMNGRAVKDFASQWARAIPPSIAHILHEERSNHRWSMQQTAHLLEGPTGSMQTRDGRRRRAPGRAWTYWLARSHSLPRQGDDDGHQAGDHEHPSAPFDGGLAPGWWKEAKPGAVADEEQSQVAGRLPE
jgi:hypothetical protein